MMVSRFHISDWLLYTKLPKRVSLLNKRVGIIRGVETVGPVSPVGHGHLRSDSSTVMSDQMSERTPKYLKCNLVIFGDIWWFLPYSKV